MAWTSPRTWVSGETVTAALLNVHLRDNLNVFSDPWTAYTPVWTGASSNPTLGNGTLVGAYIQVGKLVIWRMKLTFGSTTAVGSGGYSFTLPITSADSSGHMVGGDGLARDDSAGTGAYMPLTVRMAGTTFDIVIPAGTKVNEASPFTWATGDTIACSGHYEGV